ncbi:TRAF3-interacting protein 1, partial [Thoreauomyces humboldtii]
MSTSSLEDSVKKTADILGRLITKPPLTPKLLSKPPFRYLHDLISEVLAGSGFAKGLYDDVESNSDNVKDKDAKIAYLTKMIDCVAIATGVEVKANPQKIVAGMDPEDTNFFLQLLGKAVIKKIDSVDAVRRVLAGEHQDRPRGSKGNVRSGKSSTAASSSDLRRQQSATASRSEAHIQAEPSAPTPAVAPSASSTNIVTPVDLDARLDGTLLTDPASNQPPPPQSQQQTQPTTSSPSLSRSRDQLKSKHQLPPSDAEPPAAQGDRLPIHTPARTTSPPIRSTDAKPSPESTSTSVPATNATPTVPVPVAASTTQQPASTAPPKRTRPDPPTNDEGRPPPAPIVQPPPAPEEVVPEESATSHSVGVDDRQARMAATTKRMRPASARPAPPRQRVADVALEEVPKTALPIYSDKPHDDDDDDADFVVIAQDDNAGLESTDDTNGPLQDEKH